MDIIQDGWLPEIVVAASVAIITTIFRAVKGLFARLETLAEKQKELEEMVKKEHMGLHTQQSKLEQSLHHLRELIDIVRNANNL